MREHNEQIGWQEQEDVGKYKIQNSFDSLSTHKENRS